MLEKLLKNWDKFFELLETKYDIQGVAISTWFFPLQVYDLQDNKVVLSYNDNEQKLKYLRKQYEDFIKMAIYDILNVELDIEIYTLNSLKNNSITNKESFNNMVATTPVMDSVINEQNLYSSNIDKNLTFEYFIVGSNNNMAQAASLAVAEQPGEVFNPLFIYGGPGLGKTHLMHAIGNYIISNTPQKKVLYVSSEEFTNELVSIIRNPNQNSSAINDFREKYRSVDVLLVDDIQFIVGKDRTQEEFFHTFNTLFRAKKAIVISSDKPPKDMTLLEDRLRNRFSNGLTVDIQTPDYETRLAILKKKTEINHYHVPEEVLEYIVENITSNIRDLEGALTKINFYSKLSKEEITLEFAKDVLSDVINPVEKTITIGLIMDTVAEHFGITTEQLSSKVKKRELTYPRQICMYLCRMYTDEKIENIGLALKKHHSTIISGYEKIRQNMQTDVETKETVNTIVKKINPN